MDDPFVEKICIEKIEILPENMEEEGIEVTQPPKEGCDQTAEREGGGEY